MALKGMESAPNPH